MADGFALRFDNVNYTAQQERLLSTILAMPSDRIHARPGVRAGVSTNLTVSTGGSPESAIIQGGTGVVNDIAGGGSYLFVIGAGSNTKPLTARPATGQSRIDVVVAKVLNGDERVSDGFGIREVDLAVITGTATSGTPTAPTVPTGQLRLAELVVPASGAISVQNPGQRTVALGGILPLASQAEQDGIEAVYDGLMVYREDTDVFQGRLAGAWEKFSIAGRGGNPYAEAAGTALCSGSSVIAGGFASVNVTFPAGRFTVPPKVTPFVDGFVTNTSTIVAKYASSVTTSGCTLNFVNSGTGTVSWTNLPVAWTAVQMTSTAATG